MGISICIPTYNRLLHLKRLLDSIFNGFTDYPYEIIVADAGSTDGTLDYLRSLDNVTLIEQGELTGSVKAFNACFKLAKYEYIFWPSDDFVLVPKVLIKACMLMDNHKEIALVAPKMKEPTFGNILGVELNHNFLVLSKTHIFRASVLRKINYLDENFRTYFVDDDSCLAVLNLGYIIIFTREVGVIHNRVQDENWALNRKMIGDPHESEYYRKKWADLHSKLGEYLCKSPIKKYRSLFFMRVCKEIFERNLRLVSKKGHAFAVVQLYGRLLEQCVVFKAKEYEHLKDFYLAQKLPKEVLASRPQDYTDFHKKTINSNQSFRRIEDE